MKKIVMMGLMMVGISYGAVIENFEDGDYTNNPTWVLNPAVGSGSIASDPVRTGNLAWRAYGTNTGHRVLRTNTDGVRWNNFDITLEYKASTSGNFHGAFQLETADRSNGFNFSFQHDTGHNETGESDYAVIFVEEYGYNWWLNDIYTYVPIGNIPRDEWLKLHSWYDNSTNLIWSEVRILESDVLLGEISLTPHFDMNPSSDIDLLGIGIEETNWQYMDNVVLVPEPCSLLLIGCGCLFIWGRKK